VNKQFYKQGFSLVELMLAIAISAIVLSMVSFLLTYSANSMKRTKAEVNLQTDAKDIVRHISGTSMEASNAEWPENDKPLLIIYNDKAVDPERKIMAYWQKGDKLYFASKEVISPAADIAYDLLPESDDYLLGEHIVSFEGSIEENQSNNKKMILAGIKLENGEIDFVCNERIYIRNQ
jgi:prepilin-type N-terminal cleavage/methylation domain-containing protein